MPESETLIVFRILGILAKPRERALPVEEIADAAHLDKPYTQHFMDMLRQAGVVRAEPSPSRSFTYSLTRYGLGRLAGGCAR